MSFKTWTSEVLTAADLNGNFALLVRTDSAKTVTVTHTYTASQTFTGGWTAGAACTISTGGLTITAGGVTVTAGLLTAGGGVLIDGGTGAAGTLTKSASTGLQMRGIVGSSYDIEIANAAGASVFLVRTATTDAVFGGLVELTAAASARTSSNIGLGGTTQTTIGANGAATALTANPLGYLIGYKGSTKIVIPYYNG